MNRRTFLILLVTIAVMSAIVMSNRQRPDDVKAVLLLPGLETELNHITKLMVKGAGNRTVATLQRGSERWTVAERSNYPADVGKIRKNLIALAKATVVEEKTSNPTLYAKLGVEEIENEDATGVELVIDGVNESYRIIIGKTGVRGDQAYARNPDSAVSLLVAAKLDLGGKTTDWLNHKIIDIPSNDVFSVTTTHPDGETISIEKAGPDTNSFELVNQPADSELAYSGVTDSIGSVLAELSFDDVSTPASAGLEDTQPIVTRFETFGGLIIVANIFKSGDENFVSFEFTADEKLAKHFSTADEDEATGSTIIAEAGARVAELDARLGKWLFVLPSYKLDQLTRRQSDLLNSNK